jgi:hypothetical protein
MTEASIELSISKVAEAFGPLYSELISDIRKREKSVHGDETSWRIKGKNRGCGRSSATGLWSR